jgi:hypothetical protein
MNPLHFSAKTDTPTNKKTLFILPDCKTSTIIYALSQLHYLSLLQPEKNRNKIFSLFLQQSSLEGSNARSTEQRLFRLMKPISILLDPPSMHHTDRQTKLTKGSKTCAVTKQFKMHGTPHKMFAG